MGVGVDGLVALGDGGVPRTPSTAVPIHVVGLPSGMMGIAPVSSGEQGLAFGPRATATTGAPEPVPSDNAQPTPTVGAPSAAENPAPASNLPSDADSSAESNLETTSPSPESQDQDTPLRDMPSSDDGGAVWLRTSV